MSHPVHHHLQLFPIDSQKQQQQQSHRLRSTQKLQAILGTTPPFLDLHYSKLDKSPARLSPRTKAMRRKGQIFLQSQFDTIFVNVNARPDWYPHSPSPCSSSDSLSPDTDTQPANRRSGKSGETHAKETKTESPQILTQPFLLQLSALPGLPSSIKSEIFPVEHPGTPPSPLPSSPDMDIPTPLPRPYHAMTETEKRKKLAKLTRTLGENVPPELVFRTITPLQRSTSMSVSQLRKSPSSYKPPSPSIPSPIAESPTTQPQSARRPHKSLRRQFRPRSMTLTTNKTTSAIAETRGAGSLDHAATTTTTNVDLDTKGHDTLSLEWGKRREKDWSGEWNVKDMEYVAKALRGLKGR